MKYYIAGKITGLDDYKSFFNAVENSLKEQGHLVMNPAILPEGFPWESYTPICYAMIDACDAVYMLDNWEDSAGARLEYDYAVEEGKMIVSGREGEGIMRIPKTVRIAGINLEVKYEERLNDRTNLAYGHIDYDKAIIRITSGLQNHDGECQTLLHEMLHGIAKHFDLEVEKDEDTIDKLARGLYMVISDNPDMFK